MTKDRPARHSVGARFKWFAAILLCLAAILSPLRQVVAATTNYVYDELGRLVQATRSDGAVIQYQYDANGNMVAINRHGASTLAIASFAPTVTHATATVIVNGSGFSAVPAENAVTVGGANALVTAATATQLTITVPMNAQNGAIGVTVGANTATSAQQIVIRRPVINSFTPKIVSPGATISISGNHLNLMPGTTLLTCGGKAVTVSSLTNTGASIVVPANASGRLRVQTAYGEAVSADDLFVLPGILTPASIGATGTAVVDGAAANINLSQAGKKIVLAFDAIEGQRLSIQFDVYAPVPATANISYALYSPTGATMKQGSVQPDNRTILVPAVTTGRHLLVLSPTATVTAQLSIRVEEAIALSRNVNYPVLTTTPAQTKRFSLAATAGEMLSFVGTNLSLNPTSVTSVWITVDGVGSDDRTAYFRVYDGNDPGNYSLAIGMPATRTYNVYMQPSGVAAMNMGFRVVEPMVATLTPDTAQPLDLSTPGDFAKLNFTASAGQTFALNLASIVTTPMSRAVYAIVYNAAGTQIATASSGGGATSTINLPKLAAGQYFAVVHVNGAATMTGVAKLISGMVGEIPTDGSIVQFNATAHGQNGYFTFQGTAGQILSFAKTNVTLSPSTGLVGFTIRRPNGSDFNFTYGDPSQAPGSLVTLMNLPESGTYTITADPTEHAIMGFKLRLSPPVTGTLEIGAPSQPLSLPIQGDVGYFPFSATAGQTVALNLDSGVTVPSGKSVGLKVYTGAGTLVTSLQNASAGKTLNLPNLAGGGYFVMVEPVTAAALSGTLRLVNGANAALPADGSFVQLTTEVPAQNASFTFTGTTTQPLSLSSTSLALTPATGSVSYTIYRPNGANYYSSSFSRTDIPGNQLSLLNLPENGTYRIAVAPTDYVVMGLRLRLAPMIAGTLVPGAAAVPLSLPEQGDAAIYDFTIPTARNVTISLTSVVTTPASKSTRITVYNASGASVGTNTAATASRALTMNNLAAGTYRVIISMPQAAAANMQVQIP
jgi:YD repeat-containing protein